MSRCLLLLVLAVPLALPSAAGAQAADIEGVWSFTGGQVAVQPQSDGTFLGTIIRETRFASCTHPVGEQMWTSIVRQPDGQYHGLHQWFTTSTCTPKEDRGRTAWRVLPREGGSQFLRVCMSRPETPTVQPTIAPDGSRANVNGSCQDSDLVAPLSRTAPKMTQIATLPKQGKRGCMSRRKFRIRLREPKGDALRTALVYVNGRRVETRRGERLTAPVSLRGLPRGRYKVRITATTVLGRKISGTRKYRTCTPKRRGRGGGRV